MIEGTTDQAVVIEQIGQNSYRIPIVQLDGGESTRSYPHLIPPYKLQLATNMCASQDGLPSKRPGNGVYGSGTGKVGTNTPSLSMYRFSTTNNAGVPISILLTQNNGVFYKGNDASGAFTAMGFASGAISTTSPASYAPIFDQDFGGAGGAAYPADTLIACDGVNVPMQTDGAFNWAQVPTGAGALPTRQDGVTPIKPAFVAAWHQSLVYACDSTQRQTVWISDAAHPSRFTGIALQDGGGVGYFGIWPAGRHTAFGSITGLAVFGDYLLVFYERAVVAGINTGAYGAQQFQWRVLSAGIGCVAPRSIATMDLYVIFFGGDGFYATDGATVARLPDELPTLYSSVSRSRNPPEIKNPQTVFGVRRGDVYWASYDTGLGRLDHIATFDTGARGGWQFGAAEGGAWYRWNGMPLNCAVECRTGPDAVNMPFYWASSVNDQIAQHDVGTFDDFGQPITINVLTKQFFFDKPISPKTVMALYVILIAATTMGAYTLTLVPYAVEDVTTALAPPINIAIGPNAVTYGSGTYGNVTYQTGAAQIQVSPKSFPAQSGPCNAVAFGVQESSIHPVSVLGFVAEVTIDPPV